jgi:RNA polymerase sigma factor (sigma-70 family)
VQPLWQDRPETPEQEAVSGAELERLERALSHLSIEDRSLFLLRCREGLPYEELGEILGVRASALRVRYHRVLQRLRGLIHGAVQ